MDADRALALLGNYSKWQMRTFFLYAIGFGVPLAWMWMAIVFIGDTPSHRCKLQPDQNATELVPEKCDEFGLCAPDSCHIYSNTTRKKTISCPDGYWYDPESGYESTLVTEFDLVCGNDWLVELSMTINSVGSVVGAIIFPILSDTFGRKVVFLGCLWTNIGIAILQAFSVNMLMYTILGFLDGLQQQGLTNSAFILAIELFPREQRTFAGVIMQVFFALGYILLVPIAYFIRNWRYLQLAITVPLVLTVGFYWFSYESIPWLVANDKKKKAEKIFKKAAKYNGVKVPRHIFTNEEILLEVKDGNYNNNQETGKKFSGFVSKLQSGTTKTEENISEATQYKIYDLLRSKKIVLYSVIQWFVWFVNSIGYSAITLTVTYLPGNRYLNVLLYAVMEIPAYLLMWLSLHYIGRRITIVVAHLVGGLALIGTIVQIYDTDGNLTPLIITLSVLGKAGFTLSYGAIYVQCPELYPTTVRNTGMGICQMFAKIGSFVAPYFRVVARRSPILPPLMVGGASVVAGLFILILPETRHEPLPDTIEQIEAFEHSMKKRSQ